MEKEFEKDMTPRLVGETWRKYPTDISKQKATYGLFECQYCGKEFETQVSNVKKKDTRSCGCQIINNFGTTHGLTSNRFYQTWYNMIKRCNNLSVWDYKHYGGRGIIVCEEWLDVTNFVVWAESTYPNMEGYTLDRISNDKGYSPENCTWSDKTTQCINQRVRKDNKSGVVGVSYHSRDGVWTAYITANNTRKYIGTFLTIEEAVQARDNYITQNNLPHKLSTDYKKETK